VDLDVNYATTLLAAVLLGIGFVLQQYSAEQEPESRFLRLSILTDLLRKPRWLAGIGCMVAGYALAAWSIDHLPLTLVEPLLTTYLVWALVLAVPLSRQPVKVAEVIGALILIAGVGLLSVSRSITPIGLDFGSFSHWYAAAIIAGIAFLAVVIGHRRQGQVRASEVVGALILCGGVALLSVSRSITPIGLSVGSFSQWYAAAIIAGVAFICVLIGHRKTGQVRATLTGLAAGLVFGIQDALTRQTLEILQGNSFTALFSAWAPYALVGAGIAGIWLMQNAFSAAPLHASLPAIAAGEPIAGIALGIVVFGDSIQITPGMLAIQVGGIAALIVGVVAVARSSAFSGLRRRTGSREPASGEPGGRTSAGPAGRGTHRRLTR